ncbi:MAG: L,D-transpeptidase [Rhodobacteraceae bacterium]|nr:L,D-transpeptidase [Paracoccaceae bacterium]
MKVLLPLPVLLALAACAPPPIEQIPATTASPETLAMYGAVQDGDFIVPAISPTYVTEDRKRQRVPYYAPYPPGTLVVDTGAHRLYLVEEGNMATRFAIGVGEAGLVFQGEATVAYQRDWPGWTPTANMLRRDPETYGPWRAGMEGGLENPLGARALYLYRNGRDTLYRIHGTPYPWTVGEDASSGCIRLFNQDAIYLAEQVQNGARVIVLDRSEAGSWTYS